MNGQLCCLTGVCCPAGSEKQRNVLIEMIKHERPQMSDVDAGAAADRVLVAHNNFADVAGLIDQIA